MKLKIEKDGLRNRSWYVYYGKQLIGEIGENPFDSKLWFRGFMWENEKDLQEIITFLKKENKMTYSDKEGKK